MISENIKTLVDLLAWRAEVSAAKTAFHFNGIPCTFEDLWNAINYFAALLQRLGLRRYECVIIVLPNSAEFFYAFYGVQRARGIAVPIFPGSNIERILAIAELCNAKFIVALPNVWPKEINPFKEAVPSQGLCVYCVRANTGQVDGAGLPTIQPDDIAFLQYTSGSTGNPKGVMLTHANLLTNIRQ